MSTLCPCLGHDEMCPCQNQHAVEPLLAEQHISALEVALADTNITSGAKVVFAVLLTRSALPSTGRCRIRDTAVAAAAAMKPDTIYRYLRLLVEAGHLVELERNRGGGLYGLPRPAEPSELKHDR